MSKPVSGLNVFQAQSGPIPLSQLDANFTSVTNALNDLGTYSNYFVDASGAANQITVTVSAPLTFAYVTGILLQVKLAVTNTSATVNINVNALGNKLVINNDGTSPSIGSLVANSILEMMYDGTSFRLIGGQNGTITTGLFGDGTAAAPSISFAADTNTGGYRITTDNVGFTAGGTYRWGYSTTVFNVRLLYQGSDGLVGGPSISFENDPDTGIYRAGSNDMRFSAGGTAKFAISTNVSLEGGAVLFINDGAVGTPGILFNSDTDTGFYRDTSNQIAIALGGVTAGQIAQGSFTGTLTGFTAGTTGPIVYQRFGKLVYLTSTGGLNNTSNTTAMTMTGLPAIIQPTTAPLAFCETVNSGGPQQTLAQIAGGTITFNCYTGTTARTAVGYIAAGIKGLPPGWTIIYSVD